MKLIDTHAHLLRDAQGLDELRDSGVFEQIWLMDLSGLGDANSLHLAGQDEVLETVKRYPGFFLAFGFLDLDRDSPERIDQLREAGFSGLKPYKPLCAWGHEKYFPLYERAERLGLPILFHTGLVGLGDRHGVGRPHGYGPENMRPIHLAGVAEAFPDLLIIGGHQGWPFLEETWHNLYYYPNIHQDVSGYLRSTDALREALDRRVHDGTDRYFNDKMLFATDTFYGREGDNARAVRLAEFWLRYFEFVGGYYYRWGRPGEREKFFRGNALRLRERFGVRKN